VSQVLIEELHMSIDERALAEHIEESQDIHSASMRETHDALEELVELSRETPSRTVDLDEGRHVAQETGRLLSNGVMGGGALAAAGFGAALVALMSTPAFADQTADVQMLQTAASIENLAISAYGLSLSLPFIGGSDAIPVMKTFITTTTRQHEDHLQAFNSAVTRLGGPAQNAPDPALLAAVNQATPGLTGLGPVIALAIQLETGAAETYVAYVSALADVNARKVTAGIMGVEAQHVTVLLAAQALIAGGHPEYLTLPPPLAQLPGSAASAALPDAFFKTDQARPASEGAVK
jgi:hypothetical protein